MKLTHTKTGKMSIGYHTFVFLGYMSLPAQVVLHNVSPHTCALGYMSTRDLINGEV